VQDSRENTRGGEHDSGAATNREEIWKRLESLLARASAIGLQRLSDAEVNDLGRHYRAAATHLALLQAFGASVRQRDALNRLVSRAHGLIYGRPRKGLGWRVFFLSFLAFPETVRRTARYHLLAAALLGIGMVYGYAGSRQDPEWALEFIPEQDERTPFATREELRESLLTGRPRAEAPDRGFDEPGAGEGKRPLEFSPSVKSAFAAFLWRHNTTIALQSFFSGFLAGAPTVVIVLMNGAMLGVYSQTFHSHDLAFEWWAWVLPHGITEILAIVLLSGGGLFLGHTILAPGECTRVAALASVRGDAIRLLLFAFPMLLLAAVIESFVRQSGLSDPARYAFAATTALFWALFLGLGRIPGRTLSRIEGAMTLAERAIPLPDHEEIIDLLRRRR
jgi:uncharacterized membrane protein SpoIIM required for sporulation